MPRPTKLVVRTDVGPATGAGHLSRCLALADAWTRRGGIATILAPPLPSPWPERLARAEIEWLPSSAVPEDGDWYVADGYELPPSVRTRLAGLGPLLVIDDFGESGPFQADMVLDQNAGADAADYRDQHVLAGPRYVLLRRELVALPRRSVAHATSSVLVGLGGFPSRAVLSFAEDVLARWAPKAEVVMLDGRVDVREAIAGADMALAAAGTFCWELCRGGVPAVLVTLNRNQRRLADGVVAAGAAISVGEPVAAAAGEAAARLAELAGDTARRTEMAMAGQGLVDGRGAERVVAHLRAALLQLRPVDARDAELLFEWANDPTTRAASFTTSAIGWDDHRAWLEARLRNPAATQWIGSFSGAPVGLVRFDRLDDGTAEIGVTVAPSQRGRGWGPALIDAGCDRMFATGSVTAILARIKPDNDASVSSFIAANFNPLEHREEPWLELERRYGGA